MRIDAKALRERNLKCLVEGDLSEFVCVFRSHPQKVLEMATIKSCLKNGYAPMGYGLADFSIVKKGDLHHLFHIPRVPGGHPICRAHEHWIGHAVSRDLDTWMTLDPALCVDSGNYFESGHVWAPFVYEGPDGYLMYYTGLSSEPSQVICMASSTDPDLACWERRESNPIVPLEGFDWHWLNDNGHVRHARDPHVVKVDDHYLLAYTAMHRNGCPVAGGLVSENLTHWEDIGPILYRPIGRAKWLPESVNIQPLADGRWALLPSAAPGITYYTSVDPHCWHDSSPTQLKYEDGEDKELAGLEVIARQDEKMQWLVAFFESGNNRLFIGVLDLSKDPWTVQRMRSRHEVDDWPIQDKRIYDQR